MFGIDFSEILVIFGIALVVLGPEKLPKLANTIGRWIGRARAMARQFKDQLEQEAGSLQRSVDLGEDFTGRPTPHSTTNTPSIRPVAPNRAPPATPVSAVATSTPIAPPSPEHSAGVDEFGLADTYPAAFGGPSTPGTTEPTGHAAPAAAGVRAVEAPAHAPAPAPSGPANGHAGAASTADAAASSAAAAPTGQSQEPHQQALWPPDGPP